MNPATIERKTKPARRPIHGSTIVLNQDAVQVPEYVRDLESFRRWATSEDSPEKYPRICFLAGEIWIDMSGEQAFTHNQIKNEFAFVITGIVKAEENGLFFPDGMLFTNVDADLSCKPDGIYVSNDSFEKQRVRLLEGSQDGFVELEGSPDMVLEVVSDSSVRKDNKTLRDLYHRAGVREYWLVDVRSGLQFDIYRRSKKGYSAVRRSNTWIKSEVFGKAFQLTEHTNALGNRAFSLNTKYAKKGDSQL